MKGTHKDQVKLPVPCRTPQHKTQDQHTRCCPQAQDFGLQIPAYTEMGPRVVSKPRVILSFCVISQAWAKSDCLQWQRLSSVLRSQNFSLPVTWVMAAFTVKRKKNYFACSFWSFFNSFNPTGLSGKLIRCSPTLFICEIKMQVV